MALFDYIEVFYNQRRRHSTLGQISPAEFERQMRTSASLTKPSTKLDQAQVEAKTIELIEGPTRGGQDHP